MAIIDRLDRRLFEPYLVCLRPTEYFEQCELNCKKMILGVGSLSSWDCVKRLFQFSLYIRREKIDIVQTFFFDSTVFGVLAAKLAGVDTVISSRRDLGFWYTNSLLKVLAFINLLTDRILVNSRAIKNNIIEKEHVRPGKIDVLYNGIDLESYSIKYDAIALRSELDIPVEDHVVGIVANLNRQVKRVDLFIAIAAKILKRNMQVSFVIVGEGGFREQLKQLVNKLGISNKVYFVGSQTNVISYLQLFDIGVLTSASEGLSNSILEYMAAGLPVVCFDTGGNNELITSGKNGYLIKIFDQHEMAKIILEILQKDDFRKTVKAINLEKIKYYSWTNVVKRQESYYGNFLCGNNSHCC
ncbi:MAG: glycosyltransferase [Bacteroidetes bacterium]|nr:glycosyltransferase [Bacteroidota bacterium]